MGNGKACAHAGSSSPQNRREIGNSQHFVDEILLMKSREARLDRGRKEHRTARDGKELRKMLCLNLNQGEYMTIGESVVVQLDSISGDHCKLRIQAPREVPILRGEVLERTGGKRPDCVVDAPRWHRKEMVWDRSKAQTLAAMRALLSQMDGGDPSVQTLRRQLNHMFPQSEPALTEGAAARGAAETKKVSNG